MKNISQRLVTSIIGIPLIIYNIYYSEWTYFFLFFLVGSFTMNEYIQLLKRGGVVLHEYIVYLTSAFLYINIFLIKKEILNSGYLYVIYLFILIIYLLALYQNTNKKPFETIAYSFSCLIYIAWPFSSLHLSVFINNKYNYQIVIGYLVILWTGDIMAYILGKLLGKKKLFERVSPNKTWEGAVFGVISSILVSLILSNYVNALSLFQWIIIGFFVSVFSIYGDLLESLLKRNLNIKDSGNFIPGHGGFMDRFDGFLVTTPLLNLIMYICGII